MENINLKFTSKENTMFPLVIFDVKLFRKVASGTFIIKDTNNKELLHFQETNSFHARLQGKTDVLSPMNFSRPLFYLATVIASLSVGVGQ